MYSRPYRALFFVDYSFEDAYAWDDPKNIQKKYFGNQIFAISSLRNFINPAKSNGEEIKDWVKSCQLSLGWEAKKGMWAVSIEI